jgi:hypothetical protein
VNSLGKIVEISLSKGKTVQISEKEWVKIEYGLKAQIEEEELQIAKANLENIVDNWISGYVTGVSVSKPFQEKPSPRKTLTEVQNAFPQGLRDLLSFQENASAFIIKPRQFLGSENFAKAVEVVKGLGGQYISKGKESHFQVAK